MRRRISSILRAVSAQNLGTKNGGNPGDVYVGFFNPLLTSYGDPAGTAYFMVTNALGAYLQDPTLLVGDCTQQITLDFDFGASTVNSLQRLAPQRWARSKSFRSRTLAATSTG